MCTKQSFRKDERLLNRSDFLRLTASGSKIHTAHFIVVWSSEVVTSARLGVTVSRKVGNAVVRNRIKRLLREYYRLHKGHFAKAEYNLIAKKGADRLGLRDISDELNEALARINNRMKC